MVSKAREDDIGTEVLQRAFCYAMLKYGFHFCRIAAPFMLHAHSVVLAVAVVTAL